MVMVHQSVEHYSEQFAKKLRRHNFTTPKNYLDFISTYLRLLERKNKENLAQVCLKDSYISFKFSF
jgi:dynein heavy chain